MFDTWNPHRAHARSCAGWWRLDVDQNFGAPDSFYPSQCTFRIILDRCWNIWVVCRQRELHLHFAIVDVDRFEQPERNDVTSEAGIFHRLQRVRHLLL